MRVAILAGGRSAEREVSLSTATVVSGALAAGGHQVLEVHVGRAGTWSHRGERLALRPGRGLLGADVVFPAMHGPFGEDGTVQGLLELLDVPYVGAGVFASALCMDKAAFKDVLAANGMPQLRYVVVSERRWRSQPDAVRSELETLGLPVFVKPSRQGSSVGIAKVVDAAGVDAALERAFAHDGIAVVEEFCPGDEIECGVIGLADPETSVPGRIILDGADWYDYDAKYRRNGYRLAAPAPMPAQLAAAVRRLARETFLRVNCAGLARVDFFVDGDRVLVNELNTLPGFTPTSDFPLLWEASGLSLVDLCERLLALAVDRFRLERAGHAF